MIRRVALTLFWPLLLAWSVWLLAAVGVIHAQILDPLAPQQAYTTADPNNTDRIGLATLNGRYAVTPIQDCDWLAPDQSVLIYPAAQMPPWLAVTGMDGNLPGCMVRIEGRMSNTPCFQTDGVCDWNAENNP